MLYIRELLPFFLFTNIFLRVLETALGGGFLMSLGGCTPVSWYHPLWLEAYSSEHSRYLGAACHASSEAVFS
jgi:hypothetical protein